jgi:hypothetical protein
MCRRGACAPQSKFAITRTWTSRLCETAAQSAKDYFALFLAKVAVAVWVIVGLPPLPVTVNL